MQNSIKLNPNLANTRKSATLAINERSKELIAQGKTVSRLGLGQSPFPVPNCMIKALNESAHIKDYLAVQGLLPLRQAIVDFLCRTEDVSFNANQIIIGPGSKELMFILQSVLNTELLLPSPSWVSYQPQAALCGLNCHWIPSTTDNNWKFTASDFEQSIIKHPKAKLLILNSPNNPSGACFSEQELIAIADIARKHSIIVLSDEIYSALHFEQQHLSLSRYYPEGTIISNGISKWSGAGGWRLGFMAVPVALQKVLDAMVVFASETYTSVSAPIQFAAIKAFEHSDELEQYTKDTRIIMKFVTQTFQKSLLDMDIICPKPEGGFYLLCQLKNHQQALNNHGILSSEELCEQLLNDAGIACLPGHDFGLAQDDFSIRLALVDFDGTKSLEQFRLKGDSSLRIENPIYKNVFNALHRLELWLSQLNT